VFSSFQIEIDYVYVISPNFTKEDCKLGGALTNQKWMISKVRKQF